MTLNHIKMLSLNLERIREAMANFVDAKQTNKNTAGHNVRNCRADELTIDSWSGNIIWKYEYNGACHCHPEMHTHEETYKISDFVKWVSETNLEIEQYTEEEISTW